MMLRFRCVFVACLLTPLPAAVGSQRPAEAVRQERAQAAREAPMLAEALALEPGMSVADVGAGGGAMSVAMAKWLGPEASTPPTSGRSSLQRSRPLLRRRLYRMSS